MRSAWEIIDGQHRKPVLVLECVDCGSDKNSLRSVPTQSEPLRLCDACHQNRLLNDYNV